MTARFDGLETPRPVLAIYGVRSRLYSVSRNSDAPL